MLCCDRALQKPRHVDEITVFQTIECVERISNRVYSAALQTSPSLIAEMVGVRCQGYLGPMMGAIDT